MVIDTVVSNDVWIQLESTCTCSVVILSICTVARARIALTYVTHVHILHHATVLPIRRIYHIAWQQCALVQVGPCARHTNRLLSGRVELNHHRTIHLSPVHVVNTLHIYQVLVLALNS